jgi:hypothetical protein
MMKNRKIINRLFIYLIGIILFCIISILLFGSNNIKYYILATCGLALIAIVMTIYYLPKQALPVMIDLTSLSTTILQRLFPIIILLSMFVIPKDYIIIGAILFGGSILIAIFFQKMLVINSNEIRYVFKWKIKWNDIDAYNLNHEKGILNIQIKDGTNKQIAGIKRKYYSVIEQNIGYYLNSSSVI